MFMPNIFELFGDLKKKSTWKNALPGVTLNYPFILFYFILRKNGRCSANSVRRGEIVPVTS
jgi:hypothetical protein